MVEKAVTSYSPRNGGKPASRSLESGRVDSALGLLASGLQLLFAYRRIKPALSVVADEIEMELLKPVGLAARPPAEP